MEILRQGVVAWERFEDLPSGPLVGRVARDVDVQDLAAVVRELHAALEDGNLLAKRDVLEGEPRSVSEKRVDECEE